MRILSRAALAAACLAAVSGGAACDGGGPVLSHVRGPQSAPVTEQEAPESLPSDDAPSIATSPTPWVRDAPATSPGSSIPRADAEPPPPPTFSDELAFDPPRARGITDLAAVRLHAQVAGASGRHVFTAVFQTPSGATYQVLQQQVRADSGVADFELPVAGTFIDSNNLAGVWTAHLLFDGAEVSTRTFELGK